MAKETENTKGLAGGTENVDEELKKVQLQMAKLQLEDLTTRVEQERSRRANILRARDAQQASLEQTNRDIKASQSLCKHHKGGTDEDGVLNGDSNKYSVIKHMFPWGEVNVICTRCGKTWAPPTRDLARTDKKAYDKQLAEFREAYAFPTDNKPSGSQMFQFHYPPPQLRAGA